MPSEDVVDEMWTIFYVYPVRAQQQPSGQLTLPNIGQLVYGTLLVGRKRGERVGAAEASTQQGRI